MAAKVALTAEEFRENSQRSIALFNTEKLSTDSTHVLKSAYCILCISAVAICTERVEAKAFRGVLSPPPCRCNLHGACGGKVIRKESTTIQICTLQSARSVWRQRSIGSLAYTAGFGCNLHGACGGKERVGVCFALHERVAICTERVEAKREVTKMVCPEIVAICTERVEAKEAHDAAREADEIVAICTERVEAKKNSLVKIIQRRCCNLHGACGGKEVRKQDKSTRNVAICTERVEAKAKRSTVGDVRHSCNLHGACGGKAVFSRNLRNDRRCNLHGACGGKARFLPSSRPTPQLQSARSVWRQRSRSQLHDSGRQLQSARSVWRQSPFVLMVVVYSRLQSARSVWRQRSSALWRLCTHRVAICTGRVEAKAAINPPPVGNAPLQSARSVWRQRATTGRTPTIGKLQSARGVQRNRTASSPS